MNRDTSTIDMGKLAKLCPASKLMKGAYLSDSEGAGCFMDPPGYPTYFLRPVYRNGNNPYAGTAMELLGYEVTNAKRWTPDRVQAVSSAVWAPLPLDHARTAEWIGQCFRYFGGCYVGNAGKKAVADLVRPFVAPRQPDDSAEDLTDLIRAEFPISRYRPVSYVREFYPDFAAGPDGAAIVQAFVDGAARGEFPPSDWWERHDTRPTVEECPGPWHGGGHREAGCQFCGRYPK